MPLATDRFDYELPAHLIAQVPSGRRDQSRLLVVNRADRSIAHLRFADLPQLLKSGDVLIRNNAAVIPARLYARRPTGGIVECFLLHATDEPQVWQCLLRPGKKLPVDATFAASDGAFSGTVLSKDETNASARVRFETPGNEPIVKVAARIGEVPLPPYIVRSSDAMRTVDLERYQTVYAEASRPVAVAAPTAGLHFTEELLAVLKQQDVRSADVTLHVGLGTFKPITAPTIEAHAIHRETYEMPTATQEALFSTGSGRRVAVGTTSVRSIEHFLRTHRAPTGQPHIADTSIFIYPPSPFRGVDALITNFHQPRSTLLCLVAAFLTPDSTDGIDWLHEIYREAIAREYRFFSYGDAMLIL